MARVPEYQRKGLASALVGTPGVDQSGNVLAQSITNNAGALANTQLAGEQQQNLRNQRVMQEAIGDLGVAMRVRQQLVAEQQAKLDAAAVSSGGVPLNYALDQLFTDVRRANLDSPDKASEDYKNRFQDTVNGAISELGLAGRPGVADALWKQANARAAEHQHRLTDFRFSQGAVLEDKRLDSALQTAVDAAGSGESPLNSKTLGDAWRAIDSQYDSLFEFKGEGAAKELIHKAKGDAVVKWIDHALNSQDAAVLARVKAITSAGSGFETGGPGFERPTVSPEVLAQKHNIADRRLEAFKEHFKDVETSRIGMYKDKLQTLEMDLNEVAPNKFQTDRALTQIETWVEELDNHTKTNPGSESYDREAKGWLLSAKKRISDIQRQADSDTRRDENIAEAILKDKSQKLREAEIARAKSPEAVKLKTEAQAAFLSAMADDKNVTISERLRRLGLASDLIDQVHKQKYDVLSGDDSLYLTQRAKITAARTKVQTQLDAAKAGKKKKWLEFNKTPEERFQDAILDGPPTELMQRLNPTGDAEKALRIRSYFSAVLNAGTLDFKGKHGGQLPNDFSDLRARTALKVQQHFKD